MKKHEGPLNAHYKVKEVIVKRLHSVWFQLYDIPEDTVDFK